MVTKKILKTFAFATLFIAAGVGMAHANSPYGDACALVQSLQGVFRTLRTLAFIGAAFCIGGWAWGYISKGAGAGLDELKKQGIGLLVGFAMLFGVGIVLQFLPGMAGCAAMGW